MIISYYPILFWWYIILKFMLPKLERNASTTAPISRGKTKECSKFPNPGKTKKCNKAEIETQKHKH